MIALFKVVRGPGVGRRFQLRGGQRATVGGTDHCDYRFADDRAFQPVHFLIDCESGQCRLISRPNAVTLVNDQPIDDCRLKTGDTIRVGQTSFTVSIEGDVAHQVGPVADESQTIASVADSMSMAELWDHLELDSELRFIPEKHIEVESLIDDLVQSKHYLPAFRLRAYTLPNHHAVWWACVNLRSIQPKLNLKEVELSALMAAEDFVKNPVEETRRKAQAASDSAGDGPACMVAFAAFASGGSIGYPNVDPVEPDERLCGTILASAMLLAGYYDPTNPHPLMSEFIANGKKPWKQPFQLP